MDPEVEETEGVEGLEVEFPAPDLSKYLSNAALAFPGGPKGVPDFVFSFCSPDLSLLADLARCKILLAVDILLDVETLLV